MPGPSRTTPATSHEGVLRRTGGGVRRLVSRPRRVRRARPPRLERRARRADADDRRPAAGKDARRRLRNRVPHPPPARRRRRPRPERADARRGAAAGRARHVRSGRRARPPVPERRLRPRLHRPLLRPSRGARAHAVPRRGGPGRARARGRRFVARSQRDRRGDVAAHLERRLHLGGLQAVLHRPGSGRRARRRRRALRRHLVRRRGRPAPRCRCTWLAARTRFVSFRATRYRSLAALQRDQRTCRACIEAGYPLESWPVLAPLAGQRAYLFGQAPGVVEGEERRPWRGRAGKTLRRWFEMDEETFYGTFYCASVTRGYPGRPASGRGDRTPTPEEPRLCEHWRDRELRLVAPRLIVTVGGLATRRLLGVKSVTESVGERYEYEGAVAIPLPHPSGASSWLNLPANRDRVAGAVALIHRELAVL